MTTILATRSAEKRAVGEALIREADDLRCQSRNEKMWADGGPVDPSPSIDQAVNAGYPWLEIKCSRCKAPRAVDLAALRHVPTTHLHDLAGRLRCMKCGKAGKRPAAECCSCSIGPARSTPRTMAGMSTTRAGRS
ncbi:phage FluMu protein Com [Bradyrhizobium elkanii]|nr:phage FluMu protein Com [Bradyrhizobium elkanii]MCS3561567.1 phage FluMu protein Com [Bradyrhizobium elkanii]MCW2148592.1 phage FluMu protein Com [Bradyrhizobium elkanii]MCW2352321.1 phage FluMu protein Com [Bradyrhizobium elkanii]MCW2372320.1 phage FluMu protein Com [Bradyrhizobium elkanii]